MTPNQRGVTQGTRRFDELVRRHSAELRLVTVAGEGGGLSGIVREAAGLADAATWLLDTKGRVVARSAPDHVGPRDAPDLRLLLANRGPVDMDHHEPTFVAPSLDSGLTGRCLVTPVTRGDTLFAWLVMAEAPRPFAGFHLAVSERTAYHLASEYVVQRRVASMAWDARAALVRQLLGGTARDEELRASGEYLGVDTAASRILVVITDLPEGAPDRAEVLARAVADRVGTDVLAVREPDSTVLMVETLEDAPANAWAAQVKCVVQGALPDADLVGAAVGISNVASPGHFTRAWREAREVAQCIEQFGSGDSDSRVLTADDLGPARLLLVNSDVESVLTYVEDLLGPVLDDKPGSATLIRTLSLFFATGRSVRNSAALLGVHENTVRLRLAKFADLTGLEVGDNAQDQLSAQTALLVLRLSGHPGLTSTTTLPSAVRSSREASAAAASSIG